MATNRIREFLANYRQLEGIPGTSEVLVKEPPPLADSEQEGLAQALGNCFAVAPQIDLNLEDISEWMIDGRLASTIVKVSQRIQGSRSRLMIRGSAAKLNRLLECIARYAASQPVRISNVEIAVSVQALLRGFRPPIAVEGGAEIGEASGTEGSKKYLLSETQEIRILSAGDEDMERAHLDYSRLPAGYGLLKQYCRGLADKDFDTYLGIVELVDSCLEVVLRQTEDADAIYDCPMEPGAIRRAENILEHEGLPSEARDLLRSLAARSKLMYSGASAEDRDVLLADLSAAERSVDVSSK